MKRRRVLCLSVVLFVLKMKNQRKLLKIERRGRAFTVCMCVLKVSVNASFVDLSLAVTSAPGCPPQGIANTSEFGHPTLRALPLRSQRGDKSLASPHSQRIVEQRVHCEREPVPWYILSFASLGDVRRRFDPIGLETDSPLENGVVT